MGGAEKAQWTLTCRCHCWVGNMFLNQVPCLLSQNSCEFLNVMDGVSFKCCLKSCLLCLLIFQQTQEMRQNFAELDLTGLAGSLTLCTGRSSKQSWPTPKSSVGSPNLLWPAYVHYAVPWGNMSLKVIIKYCIHFSEPNLKSSFTLINLLRFIQTHTHIYK